MSERELTSAERQFAEGIRRLMPNYRYELSYFVLSRPKATEAPEPRS